MILNAELADLMLIKAMVFRTLQEQFQRGGYFHIGVTAPDPEAVAEKACQDGASRVGETVTMYDGEKALYIRDPWGNCIEILSCSFEQLLGNRDP